MAIEIERAKINGLEAELAAINQNIDDLCEELDDINSNADYNRISLRIKQRMMQRNKIHQRWREAQTNIDSDFKEVIQQFK